MTRSISRRGLIKGIGATAAGGYALGSNHGVAQRGEAIAPIVLGAAVGGAVLASYLRENNVLSASSPDDGLTASALEQDVYETARTRKSTNASTLIDNQNIISTGFENALYTDGKIAAIEKLNAEAAKADVEAAAHTAATKYGTTIEKNLLKSWNESISELESTVQAVRSHPDLTGTNVFQLQALTTGPYPLLLGQTAQRTLIDGSSMTMKTIATDDGGAWSSPNIYHPAKDAGTSDNARIDVVTGSGTLTYLLDTEWSGLHDALTTTVSNVQSGLTTWVNNVYDQVQAGDIDTTDLMTPRERAEMLATDGAAAQAIADLAALNIPIASGTEYTITQSSTGATLRGRLALTDDTQTIEAGGTYNPSASTFSGDAYFVYDVAEGSGTWSAYEEGIDGGVITMTKEPYENTTFSFATSKNETVTVDHGNFTSTDGNGTQVDPVNATAWEADVSDRLENDIANIDSVNFFASSSESRIETIKLRSEFTVKEIVDAETGEPKETVEFQSSEPQDDTNYITQQEWDELQQQNQELIEKYEQSQQTTGSGIDLSNFGFGNVPGVAVVGTAGVLGAGFLAALFK